jgi:hypothetical protein
MVRPLGLVVKPDMMPRLIRAHESLGRTLTEEETVALLRSLGFEISFVEIGFRAAVQIHVKFSIES